jgi:hypothetical protein
MAEAGQLDAQVYGHGFSQPDDIGILEIRPEHHRVRVTPRIKSRLPANNSCDLGDTDRFPAGEIP